MDPLLIALIVGYFITNGVRDSAYAVRGKDSPRMAARRARVESGTPTVAGVFGARVATRLAGGTPPPVRRGRPKVGARRFFSELYDDVWQSATRRRREMADRRAERRIARMARRSARRATRLAREAQPVPQPAVVGLGHDRPDSVSVIDDAAPADVTEPDDDGNAATTPDSTPNSGDDAPTTPDVDELEAWPTLPDTDDEDAPSQPAEGTEQGGHMTQIAAAEGGLTTCLNWCNELIAQLESVGPACDQTAAYLESQQVSGAAVDGIRQAQDQFAAILTGLSSARDDLQSHMSIKEAYAANPGAGTKEFVLTE